MIADSMLEVWFMVISGVFFGVLSISLRKIAKAFPSLFSSPRLHSERAIMAERLLLSFCSGACLVYAEALFLNWRAVHFK